MSAALRRAAARQCPMEDHTMCMLNDIRSPSLDGRKFVVTSTLSAWRPSRHDAAVLTWRRTWSTHAPDKREETEQMAALVVAPSEPGSHWSWVAVMPWMPGGIGGGHAGHGHGTTVADAWRAADAWLHERI